MWLFYDFVDILVFDESLRLRERDDTFAHTVPRDVQHLGEPQVCLLVQELVLVAALFGLSHSPQQDLLLDFVDNRKLLFHLCIFLVFLGV